VIFQLDRGIEKGTTVLGLLNQLGRQRLERGEIPAGSDEAAVGEPGVDQPSLDELTSNDSPA